jgi:hypothetical protein
MSKRSRKARAKFKATQQAISRGEISRHEPVKATVEPKVLKSVAEPPSILAQTTRYQYILPELRRIGIIAGVLFIIIIVLSFIIR